MRDVGRREEGGGGGGERVEGRGEGEMGDRLWSDYDEINYSPIATIW